MTSENGSRQGYLLVLEKMLQSKLFYGFNVKPHINDRLRTIRKNCSIVYDMIYRKHTNDFRWDVTRKVVTAKQAMWHDIVKSHKNVTSCKTRTLPYFEDLSMIYDKDRVTRKDVQTPDDIIKDLEGKENDNGGSENIENGIGVEEDCFMELKC
ncbi:hypothetical protein J1N35_013362 [Gossypium stocksii]|uniref:Myb/SANT-like domain-containing protein n=1 Tax=Gossypium stocksii TaxID=47602 RepID=A0A9D4A8S5_9ROSI|nr:hypothetical protein J1N35_013362 [Gossypium stocksii]